MKEVSIKLRFSAKNVERTHRFYSHVGMVWWPGHYFEFNRDDGLPTDWAEEPLLQNLPALSGDLGGVEFQFFATFVPGTPLEFKGHSGNNSVLAIYFDNEAQIDLVESALSKDGLFRKHSAYDPIESRLIFDPDDRLVELTFPHPLSY